METEIQQLIDYHGTRLKRPINDPAKFTEMINWCYAQFGPLSERWFLLGSYIYFKNEEDFTWYLLTWG